MDVQVEPVLARGVERNGRTSVYSNARTICSVDVDLPHGLKLNSRLEMDGTEFLDRLPRNSFPIAFFDPQYRGILDKLEYGNEGASRTARRCQLKQMTERTITELIACICDVLVPTGHLFLWIDKFHLCQGFANWLECTSLEVVDLIVWDKRRMGMGYRTRRVSEYLVVLQKHPRRAKGVWRLHDIKDVWPESVVSRHSHPHRKPVQLQARLLEAVSHEGDIVIDPAAGSFSVMEAAQSVNRNFLGCDIAG